MAVTIASCQRSGLNGYPTRRSDTSRACFSAAVTVLAPRDRPVLLIFGFVSGDAKCVLDSAGGTPRDRRALDKVFTEVASI